MRASILEYNKLEIPLVNWISVDRDYRLPIFRPSDGQYRTHSFRVNSDAVDDKINRIYRMFQHSEFGVGLPECGYERESETILGTVQYFRGHIG